MNIKFSTFLHLLKGYTLWPNEVLEFLTECVPSPTEEEYEAAKMALNPELPLSVYLQWCPEKGWTV